MEDDTKRLKDETEEKMSAKISSENMVRKYLDLAFGYMRDAGMSANDRGLFEKILSIRNQIEEISTEIKLGPKPEPEKKKDDKKQE